MNIRFLLFVISMTLMLFFVNKYFTSDKKPAQKELAAKAEMREEKPATPRSISPKSLPLSPIYKDLQGQEVVAWTLIGGDNSYLTIASASDLPQEGYVQDRKGMLREVRLAISAKDVGDMALYTYSSNPEIVSTFPPQVGVQAVQLLTLEGTPNVVGADYEAGKIVAKAEEIKVNAIVLAESNGKYLPIGLYDVNSDRLISFSSLSDYKAITTYQVTEVAQDASKEEKFYVLENESIQLVFSTVGGAIAEVNLPFKSETNSSSVVLPINFDRIIDKNYTSNARFPSRPYFTYKDGLSQITSPSQGGYYPLLRRGIEKTKGTPSHPNDPRFYAFNTLSDDLATANIIYRVVSFDGESIQFEGREQNRRIIKTYRLPKKGQEAPYCLFATIKVDGDSRDLWVTSGVSEVELISGSPAPEIKYRTVQNNKSVVEKLSLPKTATTISTIEPDWIANSNGYFSLIFDPISEIGTGFQANYVPGNTDPSRIVMIDAQNDLYPASKYPGYAVHMPLKRSSAPMEFRLFLGPIDHDILKRVDATFTNDITGYNPRYTEVESFHGWLSFITEPFAKFLFLIMNGFFKITGSWGFSIILLTVVLRIMMYPLNAWSIRSNLKLQEISPKLQKLQEKHKKDPKRSQMEMMQFYKEHKVNPFGGCLPLIMQMPFLFGMMNLLKSTFSLRGSSFIPGWINNLTAPDVLFSWSYPIPFIGTEFHFLPIILGLVMFAQQKLSQSKHKGPLTEQQKQQQKMGTMMTIVFTVLFYKFPSGLNIYWLSSMGLQILQQWYMSQKSKKGGKPSRQVTIEPKKK